jgi:hypothetical protein
MTHDYKRNGTTTLFAALDTLQGKVVGECHERHRHQEFLRFLRRLDAEFPGDVPLHLIMDNYGTHKHAKVKAWLNDGGTGKGGQNGREKGASTAVTLWPTLEITMPVTSEGEISGGRVLQRFRLLSTIGLAFDLQDDRSLDQAVEERHCQRTVR